MRHWTKQKAYTGLDYWGTVPEEFRLVKDGVALHEKDIDPKQRHWRANNLVSVPEFLKLIESERAGRDKIHVGAVMRALDQASLLARRAFDKPAKITDWPDPPHVEFVNREFKTPRDVKDFVETYGFSPHMVDDLDGELRIRLDIVQNDQDFFRKSWSNRARFVEKHAEQFEKPGVERDDITRFFEKFGGKSFTPLRVNFQKGRIIANVGDIMEYVNALFSADESADRLRICLNPDCHRLKYFVAERRNQKFCCDSCKNTVNVNNWLAKKQNRDSWNESRREARNEAKKGGK